ncbi:hypothetical protein B0H16DRAFT_1767097 [Mycena metata]|uniref:Uncharacterized protein n=1 Tax=Mycena metata TaxID=1033252 RepID=A0AAD7I425_9AGAR|nr:hypothetical protein B0H16DRAFT_1767097 [Mycena metata]
MPKVTSKYIKSSNPVGSPFSFENSDSVSIRQSSRSPIRPNLPVLFFRARRIFLLRCYPSTMVPVARRSYPFDVVSQILTEAISLDPSISISDFVSMRSRFRLISQDLTEFVDSRPVFWTKLALSARAPLPFLDLCLSRTGSLPFVASLRACESVIPGVYIGDDWQPCSLLSYVEDAAYSLARVMEHCTRLFVAAEDHSCVSALFGCIDLVEPELLEAVDVRFALDRYSEFRPFGIQHYKFASIPLMGHPFQPVTDILWTGYSGNTPSVSYHSSEFSSTCSIRQPHTRPLRWGDIFEVLSDSTHLDHLTLDGLSFIPNGQSTWSQPLYSIRVLHLAFRGDRTMALALARLNMPALEVVTITLETTTDVDGLYLCGGFLSTVKKVTFEGVCPPMLDLFRVFTLLRAVIDLRVNSDGGLLQALHFASSRSVAPYPVNWHACPHLQSLTLRGASLGSLCDLILVRATSGYAELRSVELSEAKGGRDWVAEAWIRGRGICLSVS